MRKFVKSIVAGAASLGLLLGAVVSTTAPAEAQMRFGGGGFGGWHGGGGFGGWHGGGGFGGWHGGGWGGGWHGAGWGWGGGWRNAGWGGYGGWGWRRGYWGGGCWNCGWNNGWWWGPAFAGGLILGAAATYPYAYGAYPGYGYDDGCLVLRRVYTRHGHYLGRRWVNICY